MVDFKIAKIGDPSELGEIVECLVCGKNAAQLGINKKGKKVRYIHSFSWYKKGSRKKRIYDEICVMDGLELMVVKGGKKLTVTKAAPKAKFKKSRAKKG